jgi:hypothetical protein
VTDDREPPPPLPPQGVPQWPLPPVAGKKHPLRWVMGCLVAIVLLFASFPLVIWFADTSIPHPSGQPVTNAPEHTVEPITFGLGGAGCSLATIATTFSAQDQVRLVAANVPGGGDVDIRLGQYGQVFAGYPVRRSPDPTSGCAYYDLPPLPVGQYDVWISMASAPFEPGRYSYVGGYDVTP